MNCLQYTKTIDFRNNKIHHINISGSDVIEQLDLRSNKLSKLDPNSIFNMNSLKILILSNNLLTKLSDNCFSGLNSLSFLDLSFNKLTKIESNCFDGIRDSVEYLFLDSNSIKAIDNLAFIGLTSLKNLSLESNGLHSIDGLEFNPTIRSVNVNFNEISIINVDTISGIEKLSVLKIGNNKFVSFNWIDFDLLSRLETLIFSSNPLEAVDLNRLWSTKISTLELRNVSLTTSKMDSILNAFKNMLISLDLSLNQLDEVGPWIGYQVYLNSLNLYSNRIGKIRPKSFEFATDVYYLNLSHNLLVYLDSDAFYGLNYLQTLDLSGNRLSEINENAFRGMYLWEFDFNLNFSNNNLSALYNYTFSSIVFAESNDSFLYGYNGLIDLSSNRIKSIDVDSFEVFGPHLYYLNLMNNKLDYLDTSMFLKSYTLIYLALNENSVFDHENFTDLSLCNCKYEWFDFRSIMSSFGGGDNGDLIDNIFGF